MEDTTYRYSVLGRYGIERLKEEGKGDSGSIFATAAGFGERYRVDLRAEVSLQVFPASWRS